MNRLNLFLLPGLDGTGKLFQPLLAQLPGYLAPAVISYPTDVFLDYHQLVEYVRERVPTDINFVLLAESFSGPIALELAASQPSNLLAVILCATFVSNPVHRFTSWAGSLLSAELFRFTPPRCIVRHFLLGQRASEAVINTFIDAVETVPGKVLSARLKSVFKVDAKEALRDCRVPILYLSAKQDKLIGEGSAKEITALNPAVEVVRLDGPHFLLQSEPAKAAGAIDTFLRVNLIAE